MRAWLTIALTGLILIQFHGLARADYSVQVGAFADPDYATRFIEKLTGLDFPTTTIRSQKKQGLLTLVRIGPYPELEAAERIHSRLEGMNIEGFLVRTPAPGTSATKQVNLAADHDELLSSPAAGTVSGTMIAAREKARNRHLRREPDLHSAAPEQTGKPKFGGFFQSKYAYTYESPTHHSMLRNTLQLKASDRLSADISWMISMRGFYDAALDIDYFYPERVEDDRQLEGAFHETYLDISSADWDFRLGRQHIIWGEMVGLFYADVVSAKDTRQWIAEDFDMIRIPQWAVRAERFMGDLYAEAIWIPFMTFDSIGEAGDDFYPLGTEPLPGLPGFKQVFDNGNQPTRDISNSAYGLRVSALKGGWDISGFYYRSKDASPSFTRKIEITPTPTIVFEPVHVNIHQFGGTLAKDFQNVLLKAEAVYTLDRLYLVDGLGDADGAVEQNTVDYVIGLEHTTLGGTMLNFQLFQRWYADHDSDIVYDEFENGASFYTRADLTTRVEAELLLISSLNREDWMFRPKLNWDLSAHWQVSAGADVLGGEREGLIGGRFDHSDRIYMEARYTY